MAEKPFLQQLGIGVASLTFGVALSIFIYAFASGLVNSLQTGFLFITSFLLMLRFWWRYSELFVRFLPSKGFWHFLFDFVVSFFGILAVLLIGNIQLWAATGASAMIASAIRCGLSWKEAKDKNVKHMLKKTLLGAVSMLVVMILVYLSSFFIDHLVISGSVFIIVLVFVAYASKRP